MSHIFPRHTKANLPTVATGKGVYLYDTNGKQYFDGSGGAAYVAEAIKKQIDTVAFAHTGFLTSQPAEELADKLVELAPEGIDRVYLVSGGSEAGGNEWRRAPFSPLMIETSHISPCFEYRGREDNESAEEYGLRVANELEAEILRLGAENVIGFVAEPVVGATAGAVPPVDGYFKRIREICDKHGILLILDEVMCGMGRTGRLFASEHDDISPDIITIAKGLGAGYQPIGAMLCTAEIYKVIEDGSGFFQHGHTYMGHPTAAAGSLAVVNKLVDHKLIERSDEMGKKLQSALQDAFGQHPNIGDIRGRGLFRGLEFVEDRETKQPFTPEKAINKKIKKAAFEAGLICYPMGGTIDGVRGDHVLLAPPFILDDGHIDEITDKLSTAFNQVF
ncbi:putative aminotransferase [Nymphon striatum]|nr:putative aminotransferase [Nymphon striatum]